MTKKISNNLTLICSIASILPYSIHAIKSSLIARLLKSWPVYFAEFNPQWCVKSSPAQLQH